MNNFMGRIALFLGTAVAGILSSTADGIGQTVGEAREVCEHGECYSKCVFEFNARDHKKQYSESEQGFPDPYNFVCTKMPIASTQTLYNFSVRVSGLRICRADPDTPAEHISAAEAKAAYGRIVTSDSESFGGQNDEFDLKLGGERGNCQPFADQYPKSGRVGAVTVDRNGIARFGIRVDCYTINADQRPSTSCWFIGGKFEIFTRTR